ncbi:MAG TPA: presqualene diphosphate synthase HpnD [Candidatus Competibacteraceae bacterium]|nr:presqualene diphosphate synthase HpnD [Candidatus Competibacteraceae bacterium]
MNPDQYCHDKAAPRGSSLYYSLLPLEAQRRRPLIALHALLRELNEIVEECHDQGVAIRKLDWWREELGRLYAGCPQHPVTRALAAALERTPLAREHFQELLDGTAMDLAYDAYPSFAQLALYGHRLGSTPALLAAEILGMRDRQTSRFAHELGMALLLARLLLQVRRHARQGRFYIPEDELARFGLGQADLLKSQGDERTRALFAFQAERVHDTWKRALELLPEADRAAQLPQIILAELAMARLAEVEADGYALLERRVRLTPLRKLWLAWRVQRRERRRTRQAAA